MNSMDLPSLPLSLKRELVDGLRDVLQEASASCKQQRQYFIEASSKEGFPIESDSKNACFRLLHLEHVLCKAVSVGVDGWGGGGAKYMETGRELYLCLRKVNDRRYERPWQQVEVTERHGSAPRWEVRMGKTVIAFEYGHREGEEQTLVMRHVLPSQELSDPIDVRACHEVVTMKGSLLYSTFKIMTQVNPAVLMTIPGKDSDEAPAVALVEVLKSCKWHTQGGIVTISYLRSGTIYQDITYKACMRLVVDTKLLKADCTQWLERDTS